MPLPRWLGNTVGLGVTNPVAFASTPETHIVQDVGAIQYYTHVQQILQQDFPSEHLLCENIYNVNFMKQLLELLFPCSI